MDRDQKLVWIFRVRVSHLFLFSAIFCSLLSLTPARSPFHVPPLSSSLYLPHSNASAQQCEICGTPRPPPPAAADGKKEEVEIQHFSLYHFNGIEIAGKSFCECHRVQISVVEGGFVRNIVHHYSI
jgi:hypothetical protein